jgi:Raf kinase inhibitor-like YbhB/YbcL family protein
MGYKSAWIIFLLSSVLLPSVAGGGEKMKKAGLYISSPAFENNGNIPSRFTCQGLDINPPLVIKNIPPGTASMALVVDDPDAPVGTWVHWVMWNISAKTGEIGENSVPAGSVQGRNDWQRNSYGGPCPPSGTHRYFFRLYALNSELHINPNATAGELRKAMKDRIIEESELVGLYKKR